MTEMNGVMMQFFHWYVPPDGNFWTELQEKAGELFEVGITALWLPPAYKGIGGGYESAMASIAYGEQYDHFDHANTVGWTRLGDEEHPGGMAVLLSSGDEGRKWMEIGQPNQTYSDLTEHCFLPVTTNEEGWGEFFCPAGSVSVWVPMEEEVGVSASSKGSLSLESDFLHRKIEVIIQACLYHFA